MTAAINVAIEVASAGPLGRPTAEVLTRNAREYAAEGDSASLRPVFCPRCRTHFTVFRPGGHPGAPAIVRYVCARCGGDGRPASLEAPR